jgi:N-terminal half of MaoC dehydratase
MTDASAEFDEATQYELRDEDIDRARTLIGVDNASRHKEHLTTVTPDAIRNFAYGVGDDNPLYADDDYGRRTRWGSQIAPNIMAGVVNSPLRGDGRPEALKKNTRSLFRGIHVFVSGGTWDWYRSLRPGERLYSFGGEESLEVKESEFGGRSVIQVARSQCPSGPVGCRPLGASVGGRQRLGSLHHQHPVTYRKCAPARLGAQQFDSEIVVGVALADSGSLTEIWGRLLACHRGVERYKRLAAATELDVVIRCPNDDDLRVAHGAPQPCAGPKLHRSSNSKAETSDRVHR